MSARGRTPSATDLAEVVWNERLSEALDRDERRP